MYRGNGEEKEVDRDEFDKNGLSRHRTKVQKFDETGQGQSKDRGNILRMAVLERLVNTYEIGGQLIRIGLSYLHKRNPVVPGLVLTAGIEPVRGGGVASGSLSYTLRPRDCRYSVLPRKPPPPP
jgi:hypothetical protein